MITTIRGIVDYNANEIADGTFTATFPELGSDPVRVYMASPYFRQNGGGMFGIPDGGDEILAHYDDSNGDVIYQSTIVKYQSSEGNELKNFKPVSDKVYSTEGKPVKVLYGNYLGAGLDITRDYNVTDKKIASYVQLKSEGGKRVALDDSPEIDAVVVRNQHGDGMVVQGDASKVLPERGLMVRSNGPQYYTCYEGSIEMRLVDGRDMVFENNSTGANSKTPSEEFWPNGPASQPPKRFGGIYFRSERGDVSISSKADDGRIFIVTPNARIQITENGSVQIESDADIQMKSSGDMKFKADGDIQIEGSNVDINSQQALTATAGGQAAISSNGNMSIDGATVNLNSGALATAQSPTIEDPELNDYNE